MKIVHLRMINSYTFDVTFVHETPLMILTARYENGERKMYYSPTDNVSDIELAATDTLLRATIERLSETSLNRFGSPEPVELTYYGTAEFHDSCGPSIARVYLEKETCTFWTEDGTSLCPCWPKNEQYVSKVFLE